MAEFIPGLKLAELFYIEAVKPILEREFPKLQYAAARISSGSEVLGFDDLQSTDHDWGPRLEIFLSERDYKIYKQKIITTLAKHLPTKFRGYSTSFPLSEGTLRGKRNGKRENINHLVEVYSVRTFFSEYLRMNRTKLTVYDWLVLSEQKLATIRAGKVFFDNIDLQKIRDTLHYYPRDVWLYLLASQWKSVAEEDVFMARCGDVGDELGSRVIAARHVQHMMRLGFLIEKQYAPYSKWFGTAFAKLNSANELTPLFEKALDAKTWKKREQYLTKAYEAFVCLHNRLKITLPISEKSIRKYGSRPYLAVDSNSIVAKLTLTINDKNILKIKLPIGSLSQFSHLSVLLDEADKDTLRGIYQK